MDHTFRSSVKNIDMLSDSDELNPIFDVNIESGALSQMNSLMQQYISNSMFLYMTHDVQYKKNLEKLPQFKIIFK